MFHMTVCPTCQTKISIPEENVGKRQTCPHCQSPFVAGKTDQPTNPGATSSTSDAEMNKTMLGDSEMTVRYKCPRCQTSLTAPASEAGMKKPCSSCGQRLQVPAAPKAAAPQVGIDKTMLAQDDVPAGKPPSKLLGNAAPGRMPPAQSPAADPTLNKTMMASSGPPIKFNCPRCQSPQEAQASEAGVKKPCSSCGQRLQVPAAPPAAKSGLDKTMLAQDSAPAKSGFDKTMLASDSVPVKAGTDKTMLVDSQPPICFNCPRCKQPIDAPAGEAGMKRPCPSCGQRLQVPMQSTRQPAQQGVTSTASNPLTPGSLQSGQTQSTASPLAGLSQRTILIGGIVGGFLLLYLLVLLVAPSYNQQALMAAQRDLEEAKKALEEFKLKQTILEKEAFEARQKKQAVEEEKLQSLKQYKEQLQWEEKLKLDQANAEREFKKALARLEFEEEKRKARQLYEAQEAQRQAEQSRVAEKKAEYMAQLKAKQDAERRLEEQHQAQMKMQQELALERQRQASALQIATINASRPQYYPWHPYRWWP